MPEPTATPSPLLEAALALVRGGATPTDLERRFADDGAALDEGRAGQLLRQLADLGLIRVARSVGGAPCYVMTSVGQRRLDDSQLTNAEGERLAELERLRTDLLSTIAHELRTPLTAVRTSVGLLTDASHPPDESQRQTLLATIERNADRMQRLVAEILDLARFRSGSITLQLRRFDARQLASGAVASIQPLAETRGQTLTLHLPNEPMWVYGDHRRLDQALVNLLSNAQKYSPDGAEIVVNVENRDGNVSWTVTDRGPGIAPDEQARLFERFFVGGADRSAGESGVGLGLPTTLAIAHAHAGSVVVESEPGRGSSFTVVVPAEGPEHEPEP